MPPDYAGQNLRGRSFKGQNLTGANFSGADIRGANFTNANLKDTDFRGAKAGLQRRWAIGLLIALLTLSALSGFASEYVIYTLYRLFYPSENYQIMSGAATLVVLIFFFFLTIYKKLDISLNISIFVSAIASSVVTAAINPSCGLCTSGCFILKKSCDRLRQSVRWRVAPTPLNLTKNISTELN
jgi:hypothetical protein